MINGAARNIWQNMTGEIKRVPNLGSMVWEEIEPVFGKMLYQDVF